MDDTSCMAQEPESAVVTDPVEEADRRRMPYESVVAALPIRLLVVDEDLNVVLANAAYCDQRGVCAEDVEGKRLAEVFPESLLNDAGLEAAIRSTLETGERVQWSGCRYATAGHGERAFNIRLDPVSGALGERNVLLTLEDVTERHRQLYERSVLQQVAQAMLGMLELPRLLHAILTGMTAGGAVGLGFNRAFLMLVDDASETLKAEMAVGPTDPDEARKIWSCVNADHATIEDFLADYDALPPPEENHFYAIVRRLQMPLGDTAHLPVSVLHEGQTAHVVDAAHDPRVPDSFRECLMADEFVVAPLVVKDRAIGVAYADNFISRQPISQSDVQLFTSLANHAALAIDSAETYEDEQRRARELEEAYRQLKAAQERSLQSESLAAIGEMTAIVAHEIRNPLSTIGGFASLMLRQSGDRDKTRRNARIIHDELMRLEKILNSLLGFSRPRRPRFAWCPVPEMLEESVAAINRRLDTSGVEMVVRCEPDLPEICVDVGQVHQVLDNLVRNAIEAMPNGGRVTITASPGPGDTVIIEVSDTGTGIAAAHREKVFDTFFTTKPGGMGLGLALSKKIMHDHGAEMLVDSQPGQGTTFSLVFPTDSHQLETVGVAPVGDAEHREMNESAVRAARGPQGE